MQEEGYQLRQRKMVPQIKSGASDDLRNMGKRTFDNEGFSGTAADEESACVLNYEMTEIHNGSVLQTRGQNGGATNEQKTELPRETSGDDMSLSQPLLDSGEEESGGPRRGVTEAKAVPPEEAAWQIGLQVSVPFIIAGLGMVGAGMVLDKVQHWPVFTNVSEIFILVPALLGLKGNLEMTLASRLSTQANLGNMDTSREQWKMIAGNLALTQAQAIVVGFLASIAAMIFGWIPEGKFSLPHAFLLCSSSVITASVASFILGSVMIAVVIGSRKCHINPDNVATPIAASLGDLTTLALLSTISAVLFKSLDTQVWLAPTLMCAFLALTPVFCVISHKNSYVHDVLYTGWTPVIGAMIISSLGGLILDFAVGTYHGIAVFQPVVNGVGGNLVAVQASRLSTSLHLAAKPGQIPPGYPMGCPNPFSLFFGKGINGRTVRVLMLMVIPGHLIFMYTIHFMEAGHTSITLQFALFYLLAAVIQVAMLLYISMWLVHWLWKRANDPDNFSIPYLTALGDLLGTGLLALAFHLLYLLGDKDTDLGD